MSQSFSIQKPHTTDGFISIGSMNFRSTILIHLSLFWTSMTLHVLFGVPPWYFLPLLFLPSKKNPQSFEFFRRHFDTHLEPLISLILKNPLVPLPFLSWLTHLTPTIRRSRHNQNHQYHHGQHIETQILQRRWIHLHSHLWPSIVRHLRVHRKSVHVWVLHWVLGQRLYRTLWISRANVVVGSNDHHLSLATCGPSVASCTTKSKCLGPPVGVGVVFNAMDYSFCWMVSRCGFFFVVVCGGWCRGCGCPWLPRVGVMKAVLLALTMWLCIRGSFFFFQVVCVSTQQLSIQCSFHVRGCVLDFSGVFIGGTIGNGLVHEILPAIVCGSVWP